MLREVPGIDLVKPVLRVAAPPVLLMLPSPDGASFEPACGIVISSISNLTAMISPLLRLISCDGAPAQSLFYCEKNDANGSSGPVLNVHYV